MEETIEQILRDHYAYSRDLEFKLLRYFEKRIHGKESEKHFICPECQRFIKEGLDKCDDNYRHFARINDYVRELSSRGEDGGTY